MTAIILDGHLKSALAAVRSLSQKGVNVICGADRRYAMSLHSKYCHNKFLYPSPKESKSKFLNAVITAANRYNDKPVVYTFSDATYLPLARERERILQHAHMVLPNADSIEIAFDKAHTLRLAQAQGIPTPKTYFVENLDEINELGPSLTYPVIIKPRHSCRWFDEKGVDGRVIFAMSFSDLQKKYSDLYDYTKEFPLVQEYIQGEEYGVELLYEHGELRAACAHRRIRSLSPTGGASVVKETVEMPKMMGQYARLLLEKLKWHGPAMVEFKVDMLDNTPKLMEINGRFWGSLPLAVYAGIDFPYMVYKMAKGDDIEVAPEHRAGVKSRHLLGDVKHLISVLFKKDPMRSVSYPERGRTLLSFLMNKDMRYDVISFDDPKPFFVEVVDNIRRIFKI